jgi:hypothetical protein
MRVATLVLFRASYQGILVSVAVVRESGREIDGYAGSYPTSYCQAHKKDQHFSHRRLGKLSLLGSARDEPPEHLVIWRNRKR